MLIGFLKPYYKGLLYYQVCRKHKLKGQNDHQWDTFSDFFKNKYGKGTG